MTDELFKLRHEGYRTAAIFHEEMAKYYNALNNDASAAAMSDTTRAARDAGVAYNTALVALLKHLNSLPLDAEARIESERAERTISILSFELRRL
jgi:Pyruvate/2-oxoacid:ferredoxin oxidoreductase gamma subunit